MNLNQSAHGDREAGFLHTRMRLARKVVVGHWSDPEVHDRIGAWMRAARAWHDWQGARFCPLRRQHAPGRGDRGRQGRGGDEVRLLHQRLWRRRPRQDGRGRLGRRGERRWPPSTRTSTTVAPELRRGGERHDSLVYGARLELGMRAFLGKGGFKGFTTNFEDLHGLKQLPGLAPQRLMADGFGFGGEGDWKTAALLRAMKVMADGLPGGTSFMEDYTYHLAPDGELVLGAHMLEVCPVDRGEQAHARNSSAVDRRPGRPGPPGVQRARRAGAQRNVDRPRLAFPPDCQRGDRGQSPRAPEAAGRARGLGMQAGFQDRLPGLDPGRRRAPFRLQLRRDARDARGLRDHRGHRVRPDRRGDAGSRRSSRSCATTTSTTIWPRASGPERQESDRMSTFTELKREVLRGQCRPAATRPDQPHLRQRERHRPRPRRVRDQAERGRLCRAHRRTRWWSSISKGERSRGSSGRRRTRRRIAGCSSPSSASAASCTPTRPARPLSPRLADRFRSSAPPTPIISTARCPSPAR